MEHRPEPLVGLRRTVTFWGSADGNWLLPKPSKPSPAETLGLSIIYQPFAMGSGQMFAPRRHVTLLGCGRAINAEPGCWLHALAPFNGLMALALEVPLSCIALYRGTVERTGQAEARNGSSVQTCLCNCLCPAPKGKRGFGEFGAWEWCRD